MKVDEPVLSITLKVQVLPTPIVNAGLTVIVLLVALVALIQLGGDRLALALNKR